MEEIANILQEIKDGSERAFELLFRDYYKRLCLYGLKYLDETEQSEEIVQDVFCRIWEKRATLEITSSFQSYLFRAVHNGCLNFIKHQKVKQQHQADEIHVAKSSPDTYSEELENPDTMDSIYEAIEKMPEERKKIFKLSRFEGLKYGEIAEKHGISVKTVEAQMGKALKYLREELKEFVAVTLFMITEWINKF